MKNLTKPMFKIKKNGFKKQKNQLLIKKPTQI